MKPKVFISLQVIIDQGGISTSILNLLNEIHDKYEVTLCAVGDYISPNAKIPENVRIIKGSQLIRDAITNRSLLKNHGVITRVHRIFVRLLRRRKGMVGIVKKGILQIQVPDEQFDAAIAFSNDIYYGGQLAVGGVYDLITKKIKARKKIAWMHNDLYKEGYNHDICLNAFRDFDAIVSVSEDNKKLMDNVVPEYKNKSFVVYNTYNLLEIIEKSQQGNPYLNDGKLHFVTVARLYIDQKRQDRIIKVCGRLKREGFANFSWYLVGGGDREVLEGMVEENDVRDIIVFTGLLANPYPYMLHADAFVLTSQYEGYGMTVKEAQVLGCPTLVTNFGPAHEAVKDGLEGCICDNSTEGVYCMMKNILNNPGVLDNYRDFLKKNPVNNNLALVQLNEVCGFKN